MNTGSSKSFLILLGIAIPVTLVAGTYSYLQIESASRNEAAVAAPLPLDPREIHFVGTPMPIVEEMLRLCDLSERDVVLDLGCGDGRLVIEAAKRFGCTGRGYDIDPELVELSRQKAIEAGVESLVDFYVEDIYEVDISDATVLTLYLLPEMNLKLLPQMQTLAANSRIVTHEFGIPGVPIEDQVQIEDTSGPVHTHRPHEIMKYLTPLLLDPNYEPEGQQFVNALEFARQRSVQFAEP